MIGQWRAVHAALSRLRSKRDALEIEAFTTAVRFTEVTEEFEQKLRREHERENVKRPPIDFILRLSAQPGLDTVHVGRFYPHQNRKRTARASYSDALKLRLSRFRVL
jgi:hypothetical protein